jgi:hypothetical protein
MRAIGAIGGAIHRQAFLLASGDCFLALGCVLLASVAYRAVEIRRASWFLQFWICGSDPSLSPAV